MLKWPTFNDPAQKRAAAGIVRFFALVLVLTVVARGTAGATLAKVELDSPAQGEIVEKASGSATVKPGGTHQVDAPVPGLTIKELLAKTGAKVEQGQPLARFEMNEVNEQLARERTALAELKLKLQQLQRGETVSDSALQGAQRTLERSRTDRERTAADGNEGITAAEQALKAAREARDAANSRLKELQADAEADPDTVAEAKAAASLAEAAVEGGKDTLAEAHSRAEADNLAAARSVEDAEAALAAAQFSTGEAQRQAADTAAENELSAETTRLDIEKQRQKVEALEQLAGADGLLLSDAAGTVSETQAEGTATAEGAPVARLSTAQNGYEAEMLVDQYEAEKLNVGDACELTASGASMFYSPVYTGTVGGISAPDAEGRVTVTLRLPSGEWKQGQALEVQLVQHRQTYELCVPLSALRSDSDGNYVLVMEARSTVLGTENVLIKIPVEVKAQSDTQAAVVGALSRNDRLVTTSSKPVEEGSRVRLQAT